MTDSHNKQIIYYIKQAWNQSDKSIPFEIIEELINRELDSQFEQHKTPSDKFVSKTLSEYCKNSDTGEKNVN
tara:strand:- start:225 stop:440 length:216 start_codon:yes stop_codon:yes gene_type:complete